MMIPAVYRDNKKLDEKFVPDPKKVQAMGRFNEELSKQVKLLSLNGLHPRKQKKFWAGTGWSKPTPRNKSSD